jgi:hypothetical protein
VVFEEGAAKIREPSRVNAMTTASMTQWSKPAWR